MSIRHNQENKQQIGQQLRKYRTKHNMSQEELARMINTSVFSISRWETGKHYPTQVAIKLMKMMGVLQ